MTRRCPAPDARGPPVRGCPPAYPAVASELLVRVGVPAEAVRRPGPDPVQLLLRSARSRTGRGSPAAVPGSADFGIGTAPSWVCHRSTTWPGVTPWASAAATTSGASSTWRPRASGLQLSVTIPFAACTARSSSCGSSGCISIWFTTGSTPVSRSSRSRCSGREVGDADGAYETVLAELDHRLPGVDVLVDPGQRPVDEVQVDVLQPQIAPRLLEGGQRLLVAVVAARHLGRHEDVLPRHAGAGDAPAGAGLVAVVQRGVHEPVAEPAAHRRRPPRPPRRRAARCRGPPRGWCCRRGGCGPGAVSGSWSPISFAWVSLFPGGRTRDTDSVRPRQRRTGRRPRRSQQRSLCHSPSSRTQEVRSSYSGSPTP